MNILFVSLGCDKNRVDAERMLGMLTGGGYTLTQEETEADIIVVNTCCFIDEAKEESIGQILELAKYKEGRTKVLVVAGCMAQRYKDEIIKEIPEVDVVIGTTAYDRIIEAVEAVLNKDQSAEQVFVSDPSEGQRNSQPRLLTTGGVYAYMKIAEGCDKNCTYCIIPKLRGHYRSVPKEELVREARQLAESGVKELILVAQETTLYGTDIYGKKELPDLIRQLAGVEGIQWIRLLYCYPEEITDELIEVMKTEKKFCHYLDLPIQHASDEVLKRMGRRTNSRQLKEIIGKLRREVPDICLRTTLITGFPGESEEQHEELLRFVEETGFDRLGVFTYSQEEDTPAARMEDQIDESVKQIRRSQIMELQQRIAYEREESYVQKTLQVLIEKNEEAPAYDDDLYGDGEVYDADVQLLNEYPYVGRSYMDVPGVDSVVYVRSRRQLYPGDIVTVRIEKTNGYDLAGKETEDEFTE